MKNLKNFTIPIADIKNKVISGAKEGTFEYYHEKAHIEFSQSNLGKNIEWVFDTSIFYGIISLIIANFIYQFKYVNKFITRFF